MQSFGVKHLIGGLFHVEQVTPTSDAVTKAVHYFTFENGRIKYDGPTLTPSGAAGGARAVHYFRFENGKIKYDGEQVTPGEVVPAEPGTSYEYRVDLTAIRRYQVTPVEGVEPTPPRRGAGGPPGRLDWGYHRTPPEQREMGVRRDVQDIMDLAVLLMHSGLLDE